jgi:hypothetical protein
VARRHFVACALLALAVIPAVTEAPAITGLHGAQVRVTPPTGSPNTTFVLSFRAPERTGVYGASQRHDSLTASPPGSARGCITTLDVGVPDARAGALVRVRLAPRRLGGRWCAGTYHGQIEEVQTAVCRRGEVCPAYVLLRGVVGRFALRVKR